MARDGTGVAQHLPGIHEALSLIPDQERKKVYWCKGHVLLEKRIQWLHEVMLEGSKKEECRACVYGTKCMYV